MTQAMYPGTFDPITNGHMDLVRSAAKLFDRVVIAIAANPGKTPLFTLEERIDLARHVLSDLKNVEVTGYSGLTVDFARQHGLSVVVRGLRAVSDFDYEFCISITEFKILLKIEINIHKKRILYNNYTSNFRKQLIYTLIAQQKF